MKKLLFILPVLSLVIYFSSCRKCYHCHDICMMCLKTDSIFIGGVFADSIHIDTLVHCKDYFNTASDYQKTINTDTSKGYICNPTTPVYQYDFCVNKPGDETYVHYFDKGGKAQCDPK